LANVWGSAGGASLPGSIKTRQRKRNAQQDAKLALIRECEVGNINASSSARAARRNDCNHDAPAGFAAAHG
jgi:hypothetical protein